MDGRPITIVGVAPRGFVGISPFVSIQGFLPLGMLEIAGAPDDFMTNRQLRNLPVLGRLRPGTNLPQAQASLAASSCKVQTGPQVAKQGDSTRSKR